VSSIRPLRRLLRVLMLEEEQVQRAMEAARAALHNLQSTKHFAGERERAGRQLFRAGAHSGDVIDRLGALQELAAGQRTAAALRPRIEQAELEVAERREEFLAKRIERRQTESLLQEAEAREAAEAARRTQQTMDEWYLGRKIQSSPAEENCSSAAEEEIPGTT
jgi:flagellar biosynthesis chaperone FliJ